MLNQAKAVLILVLAVGGVAAKADSLYPYVNPFECIALSKDSRWPTDDARRSALAGCMVKVRDYSAAIAALDMSGFAYSASQAYYVRLAQSGGDYAKAEKLLYRMVAGTPPP